MPPAARITDMHTCPLQEPGPIAHLGGPVASGESSVIIGNHPAARVGDTSVCIPRPDSIVAGEPSVIIGGRPAARLGDPTVHGGVIVHGCPTVLIGSNPQADTLRTNKTFVEECETNKAVRDAQRKRGRE